VPVTPRFETYQGDNPLALVISLNLRRRHLNESQRAMIAAKLSTMRQGERTDLKPSANLQKVAQADAAALLHISARTVASAAKVRNAGSPTLVEAVEQGRIAVSAAAKIAQSDPEIQRMVIERVKDGSEREATKAIVAVTRQRRDDARKAAFHAMVQEKITFDVSRGAAVAMLGNRPLRVAYEPNYPFNNVPGQLAWKLEIGPSIDRASYERLRAEAGQDETVAGWRRKHDEIIKKAADLEAEAKKLEAEAKKIETCARKFRRQAADLHNQTQARIRTLVEQQYGPVHLGAEIVTFEANAEIDAELAAMPPEQQAKRLIAAYAATANGQSDPTLKQTGLCYRG
jgi:hypothetical protein